MLFKEIIQHASDKFRNTRKTAHTNDATTKYVIINRIKYVYNFSMTVFLIFIFYSAITYGDFSYNYLPEIIPL